MPSRHASPNPTPPPPPGRSGGGASAPAGSVPEGSFLGPPTRTVVLVDDHALTRGRLKELLEAQPGIDLVAECADGREALAQVSRHQPHLLVSDLSMPGLNGLELARETRDASPDTRIILVTVHAEEPYVVEAMELGVRGYVLKQCSRDCLGPAIRAVLAGERYVSPALHNPLRD